MELTRKIKATLFDFIVRLAPRRAITPDDLKRADFSIEPGGKALRFTEHLRRLFRFKWLRLRKVR
ncbi:MAG: hypothetical protein J7L99_01240 [Planctomycetes bacterium]|nr:hypothetical protein [Planctomycetota bacterium]